MPARTIMPSPCAVEDDEQRGQRDRDDAHHGQPVGRIKHESERRDAGKQRRRRHDLRLAAEHEANQLDENNAETEGHQQLVFMRPVVEMPDDDALHQDAEDRHEQRSGDDGDDEGPGIIIGDIAGIAADHEHRAMRQIENAERAVNDGQARRDQRQQRTERQPVEDLRNEVGPIDHEGQSRKSHGGAFAQKARAAGDEPPTARQDPELAQV